MPIADYAPPWQRDGVRYVLTHGDPVPPAGLSYGYCGRLLSVIEIPIPGRPLVRYECALHGILSREVDAVWANALDQYGGLHGRR